MTPEQRRRLWDWLTEVLRIPREVHREISFVEPSLLPETKSEDQEPPRAA